MQEVKKIEIDKIIERCSKESDKKNIALYPHRDSIVATQQIREN